MSAVFLPLTGIMLFAVPNLPLTGQIIWVVLSYNLYYAFPEK